MAATKISTDRQVAALKPGAKPLEVSIAEVRGLVLRVSVAGSKAFEFRYTAANGSRRRLPLGTYPGLSLAKARERAHALGVDVVGGVDPAAERAASRHSARTGETLAELADAYFKAATKGLHKEGGRPKRASTLGVEKTRWERHVRPKLGERRFREIKRADVKAFMRGLATDSGLSPDTIASIGGTLSALFAFAVHEEHVEANPAVGLTRPLALQSRDRLFDEDALATLWRGLETPRAAEGRDDAPSEPEAALEAAIPLAIKFALLTLARRAEVAGARFAEIDMRARTWTIPPERSKSRRAHVVPLSAPALAVVAAAKRLGGPEFVFASPVDAVRHVDPHAMTRALTRLCDRVGVPRGSPHDFRRSGATTLTGEKLGFRRFVVSKVLGHSANEGAAVTGIYDRNEYLADKRAALEAWGAHLLALAEGMEPASNVLIYKAK